MVLSLAIALSFLLLFGIQMSFAADKMSMEDYRAQLKQYQDKEAAAKKSERGMCKRVDRHQVTD